MSQMVLYTVLPVCFSDAQIGLTELRVNAFGNGSMVVLPVMLL